MAQTKRCRYPCLTQVLGNAIAQMRKERHWSQDRLAAECGRTRNCIQQSEDYEHIPAVDTLLLIFSALEISSGRRKNMLRYRVVPPKDSNRKLTTYGLLAEESVGVEWSAVAIVPDGPSESFV